MPHWGIIIDALKVATQPLTEPITVDQAKLYHRIDITEDDDVIRGLIKAARDYCEKRTHRAYVNTTFNYQLDNFPAVIEPPRSPLVVVNSITFLDENGDSQVLDNTLYKVDNVSQPGRIVPIEGETWPTTENQIASVTVNFEAGFSNAGETDEKVLRSNVPEVDKTAIEFIVGHYYENREEVVIGTIATKVQATVDRLLGISWTGEYE